MNVGTAFITGVQATETVEPRNRTFDDPAPATESFPRFNAFARNARGDAVSPQPLAMRAGRIALVGVQLLRAFARPTRQIGDCRYRTDHGHEHVRIMDLCPRNPGHQRQAATIDDEMRFAAELAAIGRIGTGIAAPEGGGTLAESMLARSHSIWSYSRNRCSIAS